MTGLPEFNYPAFRKAEADLRANGLDVLNPVNAEAENQTGQPQTWQWYMRRALRMVSEADGIALLPGWEYSEGARLEYHVGTKLLISVLPLEDWLS
jgi:hypothetical protein